MGRKRREKGERGGRQGERKRDHSYLKYMFISNSLQASMKV